MSDSKVVVLGSGVSGLSVSVALLNLGYQVEIWSDKKTSETTSFVAAAFWYPYLIQTQSLDVDRWADESLQRFQQLADVRESGVTLTKSTVVFPDRRDRPSWMNQLGRTNRLVSSDLPTGSQDGYSTVLPVIEMPLYLNYLIRNVTELGGRFVTTHVTSVLDVFKTTNVVVNCTGLGSRELFADQQMHAARGQLVRFPKGKSDIDLFVDLDDPTKPPVYIVPRSNDIVLGGTVEKSESVVPNSDTADKIIRRCQAIAPSLSLQRPYDTIVGIRPCRHQMRLETERFGQGKTVVHNYGHGGGGVTLSWGCAHDVARLVEEEMSSESR